ncbi:MAG: glutamate mutase L, partial [Betaproteobacteria bacterium]|nr:glutamate mutase L [Betaproteobacteria bacterium]
RGLPEPRVKRSVEGDLGMRHNAATVVEAAGLDTIAREAGLPPLRTSELVERYAREVEHLPGNADELALDRALARAAVRIAVARHCGSVATVYTVNGPAAVQQGKDLSALKTVIGTGGALAHGPDPRAVLRMALADPTAPQSLRPRAPRLLVDRIAIICSMLVACSARSSLKRRWNLPSSI